MTLARRSRRLLLAVPAVLGVLAAGPSRAQDQPVTVHVDKPLYASSPEGFQHFTEDELAGLVTGQKWSWQGHDYEVVGISRINFTRTTRAPQANRDYGAPVRGFAVAAVRVKVDGRLMRGRITGNASYVWQPAGWAWEQALLYLGGADSWDFVSRKIL